MSESRHQNDFSKEDRVGEVVKNASHWDRLKAIELREIAMKCIYVNIKETKIT